MLYQRGHHTLWCSRFLTFNFFFMKFLFVGASDYAPMILGAQFAYANGSIESMVQSATSTTFDAIILHKSCEDWYCTVEILATILRKATGYNVPIMLCYNAIRPEQDVLKYFDYAFERLKVGIQCLISVAQGYKVLENSSVMSLQKVFHLDPNEMSLINGNFIGTAQNIFEGKNVSKKARFILNDVLGSEGVLINEDVLAARLGVDKNKTAKAVWERILEKFSPARYRGMFCELGNYFWDELVTQVWEQKVSKKQDYFMLNAEQRVELLKEAFPNNNLQAVEPMQGCFGTDFWTVCQINKKPLAIIDAVQYEVLPKYIWQNKTYIKE